MDSKVVTGVKAMNVLLKGLVLKSDQTGPIIRYYKFEWETSRILYSDDRVSWFSSSISVNEFLELEWIVES